MVAAISPLPVIGVPVKSSNSIDGWDSILSILQMPEGVPVATVALNAAKNAGILAAQMLATSNPELLGRVAAFEQSLEEKVMEQVQSARGQIIQTSLIQKSHSALFALSQRSFSA
jgi:5-(carboxyamino)imidazole ribonucleotide mutase